MPWSNKETQRLYANKQYQENPVFRDKQKKASREWRKTHPNHLKKKDWVHELKTCCTKCGETDKNCLVFHHKDPSQKLFNLSERCSFTKEEVEAEIEKCEVICANCHMKLHATNKMRKNTKRPTKRPSKEELKAIIWQKPLIHVGSMYGVSDNAVRKWVKYYNLELPPQGYWQRKENQSNFPEYVI